MWGLFNQKCGVVKYSVFVCSRSDGLGGRRDPGVRASGLSAGVPGQNQTPERRHASRERAVARQQLIARPTRTKEKKRAHTTATFHPLPQLLSCPPLTHRRSSTREEIKTSNKDALFFNSSYHRLISVSLSAPSTLFPLSCLTSSSFPLSCLFISWLPLGRSAVLMLTRRRL